MTSRRTFAFIPTRGTPVALTHAIEQGPWRHWPREWPKEIYSSWRSLEGFLAKHVAGKRVAMEYSAGDAVPYLDRIPAGVLEMVRAAGATVVSSGELVSRFYATWNADTHRVAPARRRGDRDDRAGGAASRRRARRAGRQPIAEHELMAWIQQQFRKARLFTDHGPNVSAGANAANPHYEPSADAPRVIRDGEVLLIDLWARENGERRRSYADQTWMASLGQPSSEALEIWNAVRDARDAAIDLVRARAAAGEPVRGADVDDAARGVIEKARVRASTSRTAPATRSIRATCTARARTSTTSRRAKSGCSCPASAFSIEPGIYIPGKIGMRSEVNVYMVPGEAVVTPRDYQRELLIV